MKTYATKDFSRRAKRAGIKDGALLEAISLAQAGRIDGDLGAHLIKQRVAMPGRGKRGGARTIIAFVEGERAVFLYAFPKNVKGNLTAHELSFYRDAAGHIAGVSEDKVAELVGSGEWREIRDG